MWRRTLPQRVLGLRIPDVRGGWVSAKAETKLEKVQPFGPDFGLTIYTNFIEDEEMKATKQSYIHIVTHKSQSIKENDGRLQFPPLYNTCFMPVIEKLHEFDIVPLGYLNNQTVNVFQRGDFMRAHIDNLFLYDDIFAVMNVGSPGELRFVHSQNGEELTCFIPDKSVYILEGPARYIYFHMVLPVHEERCSIVLRRSILRTSGTFAPVDDRMNSIMPHRSNNILSVLLSRNVGSPRTSEEPDEEWMREKKLGMFDTAKWVQQLRPFRDWSLMRQVEEDAAKIFDLYCKEYLDVDLRWRTDELKKHFKALEKQFAMQTGAEEAEPKTLEAEEETSEKRGPVDHTAP